MPKLVPGISALSLTIFPFLEAKKAMPRPFLLPLKLGLLAA